MPLSPAEREVIAQSLKVGGMAVAASLPIAFPSGAGKTSLLDMVAGLLRPDAGWIAVGGAALRDVP